MKTITELPKDTNLSVSYSGGKDSTATVILLHELGYTNVTIIHCALMYDTVTPLTLPSTYDFITNVAYPTFKSWGYDTQVIKSKPIRELVTKKYTKRSKNKEGMTYGFGCCLGMGICAIQQHYKNHYSITLVK